MAGHSAWFVAFARRPADRHGMTTTQGRAHSGEIGGVSDGLTAVREGKPK